MNHVVTILKRVAQRGDLVVLPRVEFEAMRRLLKARGRVVRERVLDVDLAKAIKEYKAGQYYGPFGTAAEGIAFLKTRHAKK